MIKALFAVLILSIANATAAQSGRRKGENTTVNRPVEEAASVTKSADQVKQRLIATYFVPAPHFTVETQVAYRSFIDRLQESVLLSTSDRAEMRRKDASDLAKSGKDTFVVWLQLDIDAGPRDLEKDSETAVNSPINPGCLYVTYTVFAPSTGAISATGHVYQAGQPSKCVGGAYHPSPFPDGRQPPRRPAAETLKEAGRTAADRVMTALHVSLPSKRP